MNVYVIGELLNTQNLRYDKAMSGKIALSHVARRIELCQEQKEEGDKDGKTATSKMMMYKLILLDFSLGDGLDGPDVAREIRQMVSQADLPQPYICCCTAYTASSYSQQALDAGMNDCIKKPVELATLMKIAQLADL